MAKRISAANAKAHFSSVVADVEHTGERVIIERHGKPVAALVNLTDLEKLEQEVLSPRPRGLLALAGAWGDLMSDEEIDKFIEDVYAAREKDMGRPVDLDA